MPADSSWFHAPKEFTNKLTQQPDLIFQTSDALGNTIIVDSSIKYQPFEGFGYSFEETTVFNLSSMKTTKREELLQLIVSPHKGIGFNMMRICIGSADFTSRKFYTYDDTPNNTEDTLLTHFSIQKDIDFNIVSVLQEALKINPKLRFIASPWSPPAWMKTSKKIVGGNFLSKYTEVYAKYLTKFLLAYKEKGIPVFAITLQNEPLYMPIDYPGCSLTSEQSRNLSIALSKELTKNNLDTKILIYDHNYDGALNYIKPILSDTVSNSVIYGNAFHGYSWAINEVRSVHHLFPDKAIYFTERSYWGADGVSDIIDIFNNWSRTYIGWVTILNSERGPEQWTGTPGHSMIIKDAENHDNYWLTGEYYLMGQISKFVNVGAYRIYSNLTDKSINNVAFINPDGSIVLIVSNTAMEKQMIRVKLGDAAFSTTIPGKTVGTFVF
ncbi:MAG: glycoside hydrolase family 30 beta sandwich domain-containing protein [Bacteroidota bacterium]|nr:glycoside hydrolase family 30 beta sandwich domain-containing protein [Bacteroidota bacterium]